MLFCRCFMIVLYSIDNDVQYFKLRLWLLYCILHAHEHSQCLIKMKAWAISHYLNIEQVLECIF